MTLQTSSEIWNYLKEEYAGDARIRSMQVLNLIREFELQRMKESETAKQYADKFLGIANKNTKDPSQITLVEVLHALQAQEQRRMMRQEVAAEDAFLANNSQGGMDEKYNKRKKYNKPGSSNIQQNESFPPCTYCKKTNHSPSRCWWRPDIKCKRCGNLGHVERIYKSSIEAKVSMEQQEDEKLFAATCFATSNSSSDLWLIDSACSNHMTPDETLFKELDKT
ncbi:uncharacterized protein LOC130745348 [Lotus japonicus]|uniref:uncharacterized protein LOC130745344 n=1 Tax=Lotus japonicus TaxID=34305 RepID=UPI00258B52C2|nr:uncharacterized protein LOC130745344 [Lotus japonicus]XP_057453520.1 uncharacterized protein LOC130745348 [Lotus japonicus]